MNAEEIKNEESLKAWLNARPEATRQSAAIAIAQRSAARVFPVFGRGMGESWVLRANLTALSVVRQLLSPGASRKSPTPEVKRAAAAAYTADGVPYVSNDNAALVPFAAARTAADRVAYAAYAANAASIDASTYAARVVDTSAAASVYAARAAALIGETNGHAVWAQIRRDAGQLGCGEEPFTTPLWSTPPPDWLTQADAETRAIWANDPPGTWDFWTRWWDGVLTGQQLPWELQKDVALIPDAIWKQGPAAVAAEIARIEEIHDLRQQATMLKEQLAEALAVSASATTGHRAHNHPPELVDAPAEIRESLTIIWADLDAAEKELARSAPSGARLQRIGRALRTSVSVVLAYCGKSVDNFTQSAIKAAGGVAGVALFAYLLANIGTFAEALLKLAAKLVGG